MRVVGRRVQGFLTPLLLVMNLGFFPIWVLEYLCYQAILTLLQLLTYCFQLRKFLNNLDEGCLFRAYVYQVIQTLGCSNWVKKIWWICDIFPSWFINWFDKLLVLFFFGPMGAMPTPSRWLVIDTLRPKWLNEVIRRD